MATPEDSRAASRARAEERKRLDEEKRAARRAAAQKSSNPAKPTISIGQVVVPRWKTEE